MWELTRSALLSSLSIAIVVCLLLVFAIRDLARTDTGQAVSKQSMSLDAELDEAVRNYMEAGRIATSAGTEQRAGMSSYSLESDPVELWREAWSDLQRLSNLPVTARAKMMRQASPVLLAIEDLARRQGRLDVAHYVAARHADFYFAFERALAELDQAIALAPGSAHYTLVKAQILVDHGKWLGSDLEIERAIDLYEEARKLHPNSPRYRPKLGMSI